jgi:peptidoglycan/LPS O-acetylase OafA/YrhL
MAEHRHIVGLDLVRFASAAMVMLFHLGFWSWAAPLGTIRRLMPNLPTFPELTLVAWPGWVGVEIFFVLSGFVITYSAEGSSALAFFRSRFLRLMPAVWICASLVFAVFVAGNIVPFKELIPPYLKTLALIPRGPWIDPVYWSLCVEIFFYGFILFLLLANRFCQVEFFMGAVGIISALVWILFGVSLIMPGLFGSLLSVLERIENSWKLRLLLVHHGCQFALGAYLWLLLFKGVTLRRLIIACVCFLAGYIEAVWVAEDQARQVGIDLPIVAPAAIWVAAIILIILSIAMNDRAHAWAGGRVRAIRTMGLMTYPLYLFHQTVGDVVILALHDRGMPRFLALFFGAAICLLGSWIVASALEPGLRRRIRPIFANMEHWFGRRERIAFLLQPTARVV